MTADPSPPATAVLAPPDLRPARLDDYHRIRRLESGQLPQSMSEADWRHMFVDNPLWSRVGHRWPVGWVLEDPAGDVVGSITNIPALYRFRGAELLCANGRGWVATPEYRGYALLLMDEYYNQKGVDLFVNTTVDKDAAWASDAYSSRVPLGDWDSLAFRITRYRRFARKALEIKGLPFPRALAPATAAGLWAKDRLLARIPATPSSVTVAGAGSFDSRFDDLWVEIIEQNPDALLAERDARTLSWHYGIPMREGRLRIFTASQGGALRAFCVAKVHQRELGIRTLRLIDYQSAERDVDLLPGLLRAMAASAAADGLHVLEHLGGGLPKLQAFDRAAPYRLEHNWPFYYHAVDPALGVQLDDPGVWDPSEYDGDASYL